MSVPEYYLDRLVTVADAQSAGFCVKGQRALWLSLDRTGFREHRGITFEQCIERGVPLSWLMEIDHAYATQLVNFMVEKWNSEDGETHT